MEKKSLVIFVFLASFCFFLHRSQLLAYSTYSKQLQMFKQWASQYGKIYQSEFELYYRFSIFNETFNQIVQNNINYQKGLVTHLEGLNQYSDLTFDQWKKLYLFQLSQYEQPINGICQGPQAPTDNLPQAFDWTNKNAVTLPIDHGKCAAGSYAISVSGSIQTLKFLATGVLTQLSSQQLIDCPAKSCTSINPQSLFQYVLDNGITTQIKYPYKQANSTCNYTKTMKQYQIAQCSIVTTKSQLALRASVRRMTVAALFDGSPLKNYKSGIFSPGGIASINRCHNPTINYSGLIVGYGVQGSKKYWKIRVSNGPKFGENGYFRLQRVGGSTDSGSCGIQTKSIFAVA